MDVQTSTRAPKSGPAKAKAAAIAKARKVAPGTPANLGRVLKTKYRGSPDVFGRLVEDHDRHRALLAMLAETEGGSAERTRLFKELTYELKGHAAAEEQALWSTVLRKPEITDDGRHAVAEHKMLDDMLNDLAARDMKSSGWLARFRKLKEEYLHHIREEEQELFVSVEKSLSATDKRYMRSVFNRRKREEKAVARLTPKMKLKQLGDGD